MSFSQFWIPVIFLTILDINEVFTAATSRNYGRKWWKNSIKEHYCELIIHSKKVTFQNKPLYWIDLLKKWEKDYHVDHKDTLPIKII